MEIVYLIEEWAPWADYPEVLCAYMDEHEAFSELDRLRGVDENSGSIDGYQFHVVKVELR